MVATVTRILLGILLASLPLAARAEWHEASSDHFLVIADQNEKDVREFTERLERFHGALMSIANSAETKPSTTPLAQLQQHLESRCVDQPTTLVAAALSLKQAVQYTETWAGSLDADAANEGYAWAQQLVSQCQAVYADLIFLAPWLEPLATGAHSPDDLSGELAPLNAISTLRQLVMPGSFQSVMPRLTCKTVASEKSTMTEPPASQNLYVR